MEWQTLAFKATTDREEEEAEAYTGQLIDHSTYEKPIRILIRSKRKSDDIKDSAEIASLSDSDDDSSEELQDECTSGENNEDKNDRSTMRSCAFHAVQKTPEHSGEEDMVVEEAMPPKDNHEITDPLQGQSNYHSEGSRVKIGRCIASLHDWMKT